VESGATDIGHHQRAAASYVRLTLGLESAMANEDRFKQTVIVTLAKRAGNRCSNPDCSALTSGPADNPAASINVGQAAHIFGANPGAARYDPEMQSTDRGNITNAIWLCGNCHKIVDDDPAAYPAGLLFEWQREHERRISEIVGKSGAELRRKYEDRHLEEFGRLSYRAERIILEKGDFWEYRLTAEALRFEMAPVMRKWDSLNRGLYMKPNYIVEKEGGSSWMRLKIAEILQITHALSELLNVEFSRSWGNKGAPGADTLIVETCRLYSGICSSAIEWEESVRFVKIHDIFEETRHILIGTAGHIIEEAFLLPKYLSEKFSGEIVPGSYKVSLTFNTPDGWSEAMEAALARATQAWMADL
jgi:hypothetical protein